MHVLPLIGVILLGWLLVAVVVAVFLARGARIATVRKGPAADGLPPLVTTPTPSPVTEPDPIGDRS